MDSKPLTREQVIAAYQILFGRDPESEETITHHVATSPSLEAFREKLLTTSEFQSRYSALIDRRCTRKDVEAVYFYLLGRMPESEAIIEQQMNHPSVISLVKMIATSPEYIAKNNRNAPSSYGFGDKSTTFTSYAQNFEDVILWRALKQVERGSYVDIGAQDPTIDSVSRAFYERGWRGIHVEPVPLFAHRLRDGRLDEEVIEAAISLNSGFITMYKIGETGLSTGVAEIAGRHTAEGFATETISVPCLPLSEVLNRFQGRHVHWLKIDVEGMEKEVLDSWSPSPIRPWIVVVESTYPNSCKTNHETWEAVLLSLGYQFVYFDGLNRFYISSEQPQLAAAFGPGPNIFDNFVLSEVAAARTIRTELQEARWYIAQLSNELAALKEKAASSAQDPKAMEAGDDSMRRGAHLVRVEGIAPFLMATHPVGRDQFISREIMDHGTWETLETEIVRRLLPHFDLFIDIGANIGWYSAVAQRTMRPGSTIHAFEPDPANFALLVENTKPGNRSVKVHAVNSAIADEVRIAELFTSPTNMGDHRLYRGDESRQSHRVAVTTLAAYFGDGETRPALVKMDTQGSEPRIFRAGGSILRPSARLSTFIVELWPYGIKESGESVSDFINQLSAFPHLPFIINSQMGGLQPTTWNDVRGMTEANLSPETQNSADIVLMSVGTPAYIALLDLIPRQED